MDQNYFQGHCSDVRNFDNGTPQGGNYVINEVLEMEFEAGIHLTAYADDLALHGISRNEDSLWRKMTSASAALNIWSLHWV